MRLTVNLIQIDNRRVRHARLNHERRVTNANDRTPLTFSTWNEINAAGIKLSWYLDQQSARLARRLGDPEFAGVPRSHAMDICLDAGLGAYAWLTKPTHHGRVIRNNVDLSTHL